MEPMEYFTKQLKEADSAYQSLAAAFSSSMAEYWQNAMEQEGNAEAGKIAKQSIEASMKVYEKEISKLFNIPQLGLTRYHQEHINQCADEFNRLALEMNKFIGMLTTPLSDAFVELEKELSRRLHQAEPDENPENIYSYWIAILERRYLELLGSSEFTGIFHRVLHQYAVFQEQHHRICKDFLKFSPIGSKDDFDEIAKENYALKKKLKQLEKRISGLEARMDSGMSGASGAAYGWGEQK